MKIEGIETFILNEVVWRENILVPTYTKTESVAVTEEFIRHYMSEKLHNDALDQRGQEVAVTVALCVLEESESWRSALKKIQSDKWSGASLAFWKLYVQDKRKPLSDAVLLPGTLFWDDDFHEWVPSVTHHPIISLLQTLRGAETRLTMKRSSILTRAKSRSVLISKTNILKSK